MIIMMMKLRAGLDSGLQMIVAPAAMCGQMVRLAEPTNKQGPGIVLMMALNSKITADFTWALGEDSGTDCLGHFCVGRMPIRVGLPVSILPVDAANAATPLGVLVASLVSAENGGWSGTCVGAKPATSSLHLVGPHREDEAASFTGSFEHSPFHAAAARRL